MRNFKKISETHPPWPIPTTDETPRHVTILTSHVPNIIDSLHVRFFHKFDVILYVAHYKFTNIFYLDIYYEPPKWRNAALIT